MKIHIKQRYLLWDRFFAQQYKFIYWNSALRTQHVTVFGYKPLRIVDPNSSSQTYTERNPYGDMEEDSQLQTKEMPLKN